MVTDILQPTHLLFILVVALLVLGPKRLPEVARSLGNGLRDFRSAISGEHDDERSGSPDRYLMADDHESTPGSASAAPTGDAGTGHTGDAGTGHTGDAAIGRTGEPAPSPAATEPTVSQPPPPPPADRTTEPANPPPAEPPADRTTEPANPPTQEQPAPDRPVAPAHDPSGPPPA